MKNKIFKITSILFLCTISLMVTACSSNKDLSDENLNENDVNEKELTTSDNNVLVVYFSATGTTRKVATSIEDILSADIYEIVPEIPYTEEDLAYYTNGRADKEQDDNSSRPNIADNSISIDEYDTILLGYPIWHGQAPRIINTFLETYDFSNKTIIPFCTSHSSGIGSSATNLQSLTSESSTWLEGRRFDDTTEKEEIQQWLLEFDMFN